MGQTAVRPVKLHRRHKSHHIAAHLILGIFCLTCIFPILLVVSISLTPENILLTEGYQLIPSAVSLDAFRYIFREPMQIIRAYGVTIFVTAVGSVLGIWLTASLAYVISRPDYRYRKFTTMFVFFTMLFSGGLTPSYILISQTLHMQDSLLALIVPVLVQGWYVLLMKGFFQSISISIVESAKIDGAGEFTIFTRVVLPISKPGLATIGLFLILQYWNDWYSSLLYIDDASKVSLQYLLYRIMANIDYLKNIALMAPGVSIKPWDIPSLSARMAMCLVAAGPIILVFTLLQRFFVRGISIGSLKG